MLAFCEFSGILTTNLDRPTQFIKVAGRERRIHHSKSLPLPFTGERFFFASGIFFQDINSFKYNKIWIFLDMTLLREPDMRHGNTRQNRQMAKTAYRGMGHE
jgi:hypothetical protein